MDLVVRTPHGDADVTVINAGAPTTVGDIVEQTTGQAVPPVVNIDGRSVDAATLLVRSNAVNGSVLSTIPDPVESVGAPAIGLLQLAGRGAGAIRTLDDGRYRIGPGRRSAAPELVSGPVDTPVLELVVHTGGVTVEPVAGMEITLAGEPLNTPTQWVGGDLVVGTRVFAMESPPSPVAVHTTPRHEQDTPADHDGMVPFSRAPRFLSAGDPIPVIDAVRAAQQRRADLWSTRPSDDAALALPFGLILDGSEPGGPDSSRHVASINLRREPAVAIAGTEAFRDALARTLLITAATKHGPADLDIVIATTAPRLGQWDWAKWLPHIRVLGQPMLLHTASELAAWAESMLDEARRGRPRWLGPHWSLLVMDDPQLWERRDSPLQTLLATRPVDLRLLALCDRTDVAPGMCTAVIAESRGQRALMSGRTMPDVLPSLAESELAAQVSRHLAPLDDAELPMRVVAQNVETRHPTLGEALAITSADPSAIRDRWVEMPGTTQVRVPIGVLPDGNFVEIDVADHVTFTGTNPTNVAKTTLGYLAAIAATLPPRSSTLLHFHTGDRSVMLDALERFANFGGSCSTSDPRQLHRVIDRLERVADDDEPVFVVVEFLAGARHDDAAEFYEVVSKLAAAHHSMRLVTATTQRDPAEPAAVHISVDRGVAEMRHRGLEREGTVITSFIPLVSFDEPALDDLIVVPFAFGRELTPLERRLDRSAVPSQGVAPDEATDMILTAVSSAAADGDTSLSAQRREGPLRMVPPTLPTVVDLDALRAGAIGDAVPVGLIDNADRGTVDTAWWRPGATGSRLLIGSPRSGVDRFLAAVIVGIADRYSADDVHLYAIDPVARRRAVIDSLPHTGATAATDQLDRVEALIDLLTEQVATRRAERQAANGANIEFPDIVVLVPDLGQLGRRLQTAERSSAFTRLTDLAAAGDAGVSVVATTSRPADTHGLDSIVHDVLIGSLPAVGQTDDVPVDPEVLAELDNGRCWSVSAARRVQLAALGRPLAEAIDVAGLEPAVTDVPVRLTPPPENNT